MASSLLPSDALHTQLTALAVRLRHLRQLAGLANLLLLVVVPPLALLLLDYVLQFSAPLRLALLAGWLLALGVGAVRWLYRPARWPLALAPAAALVERAHPECQELLTTAVELSANAHPGYGAGGFLASVLAEAETFARQHDFRAVAPLRPAVRSLGRSLLLASMAIVVVCLAPLPWGQLAGRFAQPWRADAEPAIVAASVQAPVVLTAESKLLVTSPAYALPSRPPLVLQGLASFTALQHSQLTGELVFSGPVADVVLLYGETARPLVLDGERRRARLELPLLQAGDFEYRLRFGDKETPPLRVHVEADTPPRFLRVSGSEEVQAVLPYQAVPVEFLVEDDFGVEKALLEYAVNGTATTLEIPLQGGGQPQARGTHVLRLALLKTANRTLQPGDEVRYRLRVCDNRRVADLGPNETLYPAAGWRTLRLAQHAEPLGQPELTAQHETLGQQLEKTRQELERERAALARIRKGAKDQQELSADLRRDLNQLRQEQLAVRDTLAEIAQTAAGSPELTSLAEEAQQLVDRELGQVGRELASAEGAEPAERDERLDRAGTKLRDAVRTLDELLRANQRLAKERTEELKLDLKAEAQQQLAERVGTSETATLSREEADLAGELYRLAEKSDRLRMAKEAAVAAHLREQAERLGQLMPADKGKPNPETVQKAATAVEEMRRLGQQTGMDEPNKIASLTAEAQKAMELAQKQDEQGKPTAAAESRKQARAALEKAATLAKQTAERLTAPAEGADLGQLMLKAQDAMKAAQTQLAADDKPEARAAMQRAADQLRQSAQKLSAQSRPAENLPKAGGSPKSAGGVGGQAPDYRLLDARLEPYVGKRWGELPGEVRTQIIQDLSRRYGPEQARVIERYYERVASGP